MTRDEAIEKFSHTRLHMMGDRSSGAWIEMFEALGLIEIDEPHSKTIYGKIGDAMAHVTDRTAPADVRLAFEAAGLKIVEK